MKVMMTSIPKSGTHLLQNILDLGGWFAPHFSKVDILINEWLEQPIFTGHIIPHPKILAELEETGHTVIFLHREPKDTIVSVKYHWVDRSPIWSPYTGYEKFGMDFTDPILWLIENFKPFYDYMMEWTVYADHVITYEQIINMPNEHVLSVVDAFGLDRPGARKRSRQKVKRYRTGKSGNWKHEFEPHHIEAYERIWEAI